MRKLTVRPIIYILSVLIFHLTAAAGHGAGRSGAIEGMVTNKVTGEPVGGVSIVVQSGETPGSIRAITSINGRYFIKNLAPGRYKLSTRRLGYESIQQELEVTVEKIEKASFSIGERVFEAPEIVIESKTLTGGLENIFRLPGSAHYLGKTELEQHNYNDINRILKEIPGVNIQEEDGYGLRPNIGLRGAPVERSSKITVMEDNTLAAPAPYSEPAAYYFPTVGRMEGVEVRKGSSQIKYGPLTTGGAINLISSRIPEQFQGEATLLGGSNAHRRLQFKVGDSYKYFGWLAESFQVKDDGFKELDGGGNTGFDIKDYLLKFRLNNSPTAGVYHSLEFKLAQTDEISNETYLGLTEADFALDSRRRYFASRNDVMNTGHEQYSVSYFIAPSELFNITTTAYHNNFRRNWYKLDRVKAAASGSSVSIDDLLADPSSHLGEYAVITGATSFNDDALEVKANNRKYFSRGIRSEMALRFDTGAYTHELELGLLFHEDEIDRYQWVDKYKMDSGVMELTGPGIPGSESNRVAGATAQAIFFQYAFSSDHWRITPGIRHESISLDQNDYGKNDPGRSGANLKYRKNEVNVWIPGIGIGYTFSPHLSSFVGIHRGFSPPGSTEGARPEESINYEAGLRYRRNSIRLEGVFFYNDYSNLLGSDLFAAGGSGSGDRFNGGESFARGFELSAHYDLGLATGRKYSIPARLAYTFTEARFESDFNSDFEAWGSVRDGDRLPYLPEHQLFLGLGLEKRLWKVNLTSKYMGKMRTTAGSGPFIPSETVEEHMVLDASAEYLLTANNRLFLGVQNLTDNNYVVARRPAGLRPGLPRTFLLGIKTSF